MPQQENQPLPAGYVLNGYRIEKPLSSGGFSIVYLARDEAGTPFAIKEYLPSSLPLRGEGGVEVVINDDANLAIFRHGLKCFFEEGRALAMISHPNVVRVENFFRANETCYMVMQYVRGRTLQFHIQRHRHEFTEGFIRRLFINLMNGLREVHANKLLHLDLKPANIYLRTDGTPMLLDFGAARQTVNTDLPKLTPMYTPGFAPPELYTRNATLGPWTDVYSIGASMFACMVGSPPQPADQRKTEDKMEAHFQKLDGLYSDELIKLVRWCLALDPLARPQSLFALQKVLQAPAPEAPAPAPQGALERLGGGLRGLVGRLGGLGRARDKTGVKAGPDTQQ
jgi:serine/threonine protein kinase